MLLCAVGFCHSVKILLETDQASSLAFVRSSYTCGFLLALEFALLFPMLTPDPAFFSFLVKGLCYRGRSATCRQFNDHDCKLFFATLNTQAVAWFECPARFYPVSVEMDFSTRDCLTRERSCLEESRGPKPFVYTDRLIHAESVNPLNDQYTKSGLLQTKKRHRRSPVTFSLI